MSVLADLGFNSRQCIPLLSRILILLSILFEGVLQQPQIPESPESVISVLTPIAQEVFRGTQPIWKVQIDNPSELYLLNIEWYPRAATEHQGAQFKPIPVPEIKVRKAGSGGLISNEAYFDISAVSSGLDGAQVTIPLKGGSQFYYVSMISQHADFMFKVRLNSEHLALLPSESSTIIATHDSSITIQLEKLVAGQKYAVEVQICEGRLASALVIQDSNNQAESNNKLRFDDRKDGLHVVALIAKANTQNKVILVRGSNELVVMRLKIMSLVDAARLPEIMARQSIYPAEYGHKPELPDLDIRSTGSSQFELKIGPSSELANYSLIAGLSESSVKFRARCHQDELVFLYTSLNEEEKQTLQHRNNPAPTNGTNNNTLAVNLRAQKVQLGILSSGSYVAAKGYVTKVPDGEPIFLKSILEGHEYYYLSQVKGILLQNTQILDSRPGMWWSVARWVEEPDHSQYLWIVPILAVLFVLLFCCRTQRSESHHSELSGRSTQIELPDSGRRSRDTEQQAPNLPEREDTESSDPEPEADQEI